MFSRVAINKSDYFDAEKTRELKKNKKILELFTVRFLLILRYLVRVSKIGNARNLPLLVARANASSSLSLSSRWLQIYDVEIKFTEVKSR